eukprot:CAMPEP_0174251912 /NCGR_PEP_ID=MMETSP0439-20130205/1588_1 /TAXON_ID=0 /ORGANISM="Stereomyxa ramosa, Strain Chinc5" /LENGTH=157 /DNA_ID=CAMNT_0015332353 /DNA_START=46 /DNA_END=519 /DNA_ORIENTATION=+
MSLTEEQKAELKTKFDEIDTDSDGSISLEEYASWLIANRGMKRTWQEETNDLMKKAAFVLVDSDNNGQVSFDEFCSFFQLPAKERKERTDRATARIMFDCLDTNKDGVLDKDEVRTGMYALGDNVMDDDEFEAEFKEMDGNGDGVISFDEFWKIMYD